MHTMCNKMARNKCQRGGAQVKADVAHGDKKLIADSNGSVTWFLMSTQELLTSFCTKLRRLFGRFTSSSVDNEIRCAVDIRAHSKLWIAVLISCSTH